jgi:ATP-dependent DNA ligase
MIGEPGAFGIPTRGTTVPHTPDWRHEVNYDGYRLRLERDGDRVRLITRGGYNWTNRYPVDRRRGAEESIPSGS